MTEELLLRAVSHARKWGASGAEVGSMLAAFAEAEIARLAAKPADDGVREATLTFTAVVDSENVVHSRIETHGSSFADAYDALFKVRKEIDHQIEERRNCPAYRASRECPGCGRAATGCSSTECPMAARTRIRALSTKAKP